MKNWSLRSKIVVMASLVVMVACLILTIISITSANKFMHSLITYDTGFSAQEDIGKEKEPNDSRSSKGIVEDEFSKQDTMYNPISTMPENQIAFRDTMNDFTRNAVFAMVFTILILAAAIFIVTGKILKPLSRLTYFISSIDDKNLCHRVELPQDKDEVYRLTQSFNHMMDRLEASYTAQKNFAANAAHELKTPLSIMNTSLQVLELQNTPDYEDYIEFTDDIRQSLSRLIQTVESLLTLTNSSLKNETESIDTLFVANQIRNDLSLLAEEKGVCVTVTGDAFQISYNKELFYRVIYNLVENAVKYNQRGGYVNVTVSSKERYILIQDNGIGMDEESIQNIFQPFYRSDLSRSPKVPGSGLGMSIVKSVLDRYGGTLEINSILGKGTEIKFKL